MQKRLFTMHWVYFAEPSGGQNSIRHYNVPHNRIMVLECTTIEIFLFAFEFDSALKFPHSAIDRTGIKIPLSQNFVNVKFTKLKGCLLVQKSCYSISNCGSLALAVQQ